MAAKQIILVVGVTGSQGGSVARVLLQRGQFAVRGLTRNVNSEKAIALQKSGIEMVQGDLSDPQSVEKALQGAYGMYLVTNTWEHGKDLEVQHGKEAANAAKKAGIQHLVFSGLENAEKLTGGKNKVEHFTGKAHIEDHIRSLGIPHSFVHACFYYENFTKFGMLQRQGDNLSICLPTGDNKLGMVAEADIGEIAGRVFEHRDKYLGKTTIMQSDYISIPEFIAAFEEVFGKKIQWQPVDYATYGKFPFPGAHELADMFEFLVDVQPYKDGLAQSKELYPDVKNIRAWLQTDPFGMKKQ
eukprot:TRINITY_DN3016_c0_g1_i1.p1 TRINITY_DN3016_c0_g1~~TRINITY_DN3016_c0_g1_i1.p1  ORF type:complete len:299 (+),score=69.06 TRINITY_DN3016_c0_g1_i1:65-961(+)